LGIKTDYNSKILAMTTKTNKLDFSGQNIYIGLDTHKNSWKVTILTDTISHKTFSQNPDPEVLCNYLVRNFPGATYYSAYEASYCGFWIHNRLTELGIKSIIVNAGDIPTTNKEKVQKEDKRDSRKIAKCLRNGELLPIYIPSQRNLEDRNLMRIRLMIAKDTRRIKNRIRSLLFFYGISVPERFKDLTNPWTNKYIQWIESIDIIENNAKESLNILLTECKMLRSFDLETLQKIRGLSQTDKYREQVRLLLTIPGIGLKTAMLILTELFCIDRFKTLDQLCSYVGIIPSTRSTGDNEIVGDITPRGHNILRSAIIESAWIAVRADPALNLAYNTLCKKMKANKAITRIGKKLLNRIRYVLLNQHEYVGALVK
jgi:transposase